LLQVDGAGAYINTLLSFDKRYDPVKAGAFYGLKTSKPEHNAALVLLCDAEADKIMATIIIMAGIISPDLVDG